MRLSVDRKAPRCAAMRGTSGPPRHTKWSRYRCSLPGLAGFTGNRCTEPEVPPIGSSRRNFFCSTTATRSLAQHFRARKPTALNGNATRVASSANFEPLGGRQVCVTTRLQPRKTPSLWGRRIPRQFLELRISSPGEAYRSYCPRPQTANSIFSYGVAKMMWGPNILFASTTTTKASSGTVESK